MPPLQIKFEILYLHKIKMSSFFIHFIYIHWSVTIDVKQKYRKSDSSV